MRHLIGAMAHKDIGGQPIRDVANMALLEVLDWMNLLAEVTREYRVKD